MFEAGTAGTGGGTGNAALAFSARASMVLGWRLAAKSAQSCLGIERAVSSALWSAGLRDGCVLWGSGTCAAIVACGWTGRFAGGGAGGGSGARVETKIGGTTGVGDSGTSASGG